MESAGQGSGKRRVAGDSGSVRGKSGHRDTVHKGELSDGLGEKKSRQSKEP